MERFPKKFELEEVLERKSKSLKIFLAHYVSEGVSLLIGYQFITFILRFGVRGSGGYILNDRSRAHGYLSKIQICMNFAQRFSSSTILWLREWFGKYYVKNFSFINKWNSTIS